MLNCPPALAPAAPSPLPLVQGCPVCVQVSTPARVVAAGWGWPARHSPWRCWAGPSAACLSAAFPRKTSAGWRRARPRGSGGDASSCPLCPWIGPPGGGRDPWRGAVEAGTPHPRYRWRCRWTGLQPRSLDRNRPGLQSALRSCWREARGSRLAAGTDFPVHRNIQSELLERENQLLLSESPTHNTISCKTTGWSFSGLWQTYFRTNSSFMKPLWKRLCPPK